MARRLGYVGKSCIHPSQVALANEIFQPDAEQIAAARRIVAAAQEAGARGRGAFVVDGRMVDLPFLKRAEALLASLDCSETSTK
jgi:citrate lyase subunit beta/citryl-CoA lyase